MALVIGKASKFYTEWDVVVDKNYNNKGELVSEIAHYSYHKNISTDIAKVKALYPTTEIDENLHGHSSFQIVRIANEKPIPMGCFRFGKYKEDKFEQCSDFGYLNWYYNEGGVRPEEREDYFKIMCSLNDDLTIVDGELVSKAVLEKRKANEEFENLVNTGKPFELFCNYSLDEDGIAGEYHEFVIKFSEFKTMYYRDMVYGLPLLKGKAKRIKGNTLIIKNYCVEYHEANGITSKMIVVFDFDIKKEILKKGNECTEDELSNGAKILNEVAKTNKVAKADIEQNFFEENTFNGVKKNYATSTEFVKEHKDLFDFVVGNIVYYAWRDNNFKPSNAEKKQFKEYFINQIVNKYYA